MYKRQEQRLYVKKKAETENGPSKLMDYWLIYEKKDCRLMSRTASVEEKREVSQPISYGADYSGLIRTVYQPAYAVYKKGEQILDRQGNPIPVMERVCEYGERPQTYITQMLEPVKAVYDGDQAIYRIHVENETDWSKTAEPVQEDVYKRQAWERSLAKDEERIEVLEKMVLRLYEDMMAGRISDTNFNLMLGRTQTEQAELKARVEEVRKRLSDEAKIESDARQWIDAIQEYADITELDAATLNRLIKEIVVHRCV